MTFELRPGQWQGLTEFPSAASGLASSPVLIKSVSPLKSGKGLLKVRWLRPLAPAGGADQTMIIRIMLRAERHLVGTVEDGGVHRTLVICRLDWDWLPSHCGDLLRRRLPAHAVDGVEAPGVEEYLTAIFGADDADILNGARRDSFAANTHAMPQRHKKLALDAAYAPIDSILIARGFVPNDMDDRWFISLDGASLIFRRSWTGFVIFQIETAWRGASLYLGAVTVNRDPDQYGGTDDAADIETLKLLINAHLLHAPTD